MPIFWQLAAKLTAVFPCGLWATRYISSASSHLLPVGISDVPWEAQQQSPNNIWIDFGFTWFTRIHMDISSDGTMSSIQHASLYWREETIRLARNYRTLQVTSTSFHPSPIWWINIITFKGSSPKNDSVCAISRSNAPECRLPTFIHLASATHSHLTLSAATLDSPRFRGSCAFLLRGNPSTKAGDGVVS